MGGRIVNAVLIYSGGLDSTVLLARLLADQALRTCISIDYAQRHIRELQHALEITRYYRVEHLLFDLSDYGRLLKSSSQTNPRTAPPAGHYADPTMRITVVPNRNMIMLALAAGIAIDRGYDTVAYAAHAGDHAVYPDCRPMFMDAMTEALALSHYEPIDLYTPFREMTKAEIVRMGRDLAVPFEKTYSCYNGRELHCGTCGTCVERHEAFELAGVPDPTRYAV